LKILVPVFDDFINNVQSIIDQLKDENVEREVTQDFKKEEFWSRIFGATKVVSHEATKLCMTFSRPPLPPQDECTPLLRSLEMSCVGLMSAYYAFPVAQGRTLRKRIKSSLLNILDAVINLSSSIKLHGCTGCQSQLHCTGSVWEHCNHIESLPTDNKQAVLYVFKSQSSLVGDAVDELQEAIQEEPIDGDAGGDAPEDAWSDADRLLLPTCLGLVKTAKSCCKKVYQSVDRTGSCTSEQNCRDLDELSQAVGDLSPAVDDFVTSLYPPLRKPTVYAMAVTLSQKLRGFLELHRSTHCFTEDDRSWSDFLENAINHNTQKVQNVTDPNRAG
jgi:hypothetical protein